MTEAGIILAVAGFILGSIQYYIRTRLQDTKEDILRIMRHYETRAERGALSLAESINIMRTRLKNPNFADMERKEYKNCIEEYDNMMFLMKFFGIYFPFLALLIYFLWKTYSPKLFMLF